MARFTFEWPSRSEITFGCTPALASSLVSNGIDSVVRHASPSVCSSEKIPIRWQCVIVCGGLRGTLALALALSLDSAFPDRALVIDLTFGVVVFSIFVQGLTVRPLVRSLRLASGS